MPYKKFSEKIAHISSALKIQFMIPCSCVLAKIELAVQLAKAAWLQLVSVCITNNNANWPAQLSNLRGVPKVTRKMLIKKTNQTFLYSTPAVHCPPPTRLSSKFCTTMRSCADKDRRVWPSKNISQKQLASNTQTCSGHHSGKVRSGRYSEISLPIPLLSPASSQS